MFSVSGIPLLVQYLCNWTNGQQLNTISEPYDDIEWRFRLDKNALKHVLSDSRIADDALFMQYEEESLFSLFNNCLKYSSMNLSQDEVEWLIKDQGKGNYANVTTCIGLLVLSDKYISDYIERITDDKFSLMFVLSKILENCKMLNNAASALARDAQLCNGGNVYKWKAFIDARKRRAYEHVKQLTNAAQS
ncbi:hypothetical protein PAPHI01_0337 [Pancytospora philotis]|nr:hypothetical protein PAPHI01_0337 [Pancytospora philotis]